MQPIWFSNDIMAAIQIQQQDVNNRTIENRCINSCLHIYLNADICSICLNEKYLNSKYNKDWKPQRGGLFGVTACTNYINAKPRLTFTSGLFIQLQSCLVVGYATVSAPFMLTVCNMNSDLQIVVGTEQYRE